MLFVVELGDRPVRPSYVNKKIDLGSHTIQFTVHFVVTGTTPSKNKLHVLYCTLGLARLACNRMIIWQKIF